MNRITKDDIKSRLLKRYADGWGGQGDRVLVETQSMSNHTRLGAVLFALDGSPPKGYALYIPGHYRITFMDAFGKQFYSLQDIVVEGVKDR